MRRSTLAIAALAAAMLVPSANAQDAGDYPNQPIRIIVPTSPGSGTDAAVRLLIEPVGAKLGQPFYVENVGGGGTTVGAAQAARAEPDGYTLLASTVTSVALAPLLYDNLAYEAGDFVAVTQINESTAALIVNPTNLPVNSLEELVEELRANPGKYNYGSVGPGTELQMQKELFMAGTGTEIEHIAYRSGGEVMQAVLGGHIDLAFNALASSMPQIQDGALRAVAVTTLERDPNLPDVQTVHEVFPDIPAVSLWAGLFAPAGTPEPILEKLSGAFAEYLQSDEGREAMLRAGGSRAVGSTPQEFSGMLETERDIWAHIIEVAGITVE